MNRLVICLSLLLVFGGPVFSWQWPTEGVLIAVAFGQDQGDSYSRGVTLGGGVQPVYPVSGGVVVYAREAAEDPASVLGTTVVVDHSGGFRSLYGHLESGSVPRIGTVVTESTQIGLVGESGAADRPELYFSVLDTAAGVYVNPLLLLPPVEDSVFPTIVSVLAEGAASLYDLGVVSALPSGDYDLLVECTDRESRGGARIAPYSFSALVNGEEVLSIVNDRLLVSDSAEQIQPGPAVPRESLHTTDGRFVVRGITVPVGRTVIEIVAADYAGNAASSAYEIEGVR